MKKILSGLILMTAMLASCKKDHSKVPGTDKNFYKISFNTGFKQQIVPLDSAGSKKTAATDPTITANFQITVIYYVVYDSAGNLVHSIRQLSSDPSFGSYTDNLHSGTYTVAVVAGESTIFIGQQPGKLSTDLIFYGNNTSRQDFKGDALYKKFNLTVGATNANVDVDLTRITSRVDVLIKDALPLDAKYVTVSGIISSTAFSLGAETVIGSSKVYAYQRNISPSEVGTKNLYIYCYFLHYTSPMTIKVTCYSTIGKVLAEKVLTIPIAPNTITTLIGNLFGGAGDGGTGGGFTPALNTDWNTTPITKEF